MKKIAGILLCLLNFNAFAQIEFEKGYIIEDSGIKKEVLIKNEDWKSNPERIEYKDSENSEIFTAGIRNIQEFAIYNQTKFIRKKVNLDRSSDELGDLNTHGASELKEEELFIKVLIEGEANFFSYTDGRLKRFFYSKPGQSVTQLIWKRYFTADKKIAENGQFRQQLWNNLRCGNITSSNIARLEYRKRDLFNFIIKYNKCKGSDFVSYDYKNKKDLFNLHIRPRLHSSSLSITHPNSPSQSPEFSKQTSFGIGVQAEFILPFHKNKWSVIIEPTYQSYQDETNYKTTAVTKGEVDALVEYNSIELPVGVRHYFYLGEKSAIFANAVYVFDQEFNSEVIYKRSFNGTTYNKTEITSGTNLGFGLGFKVAENYSIELRYQTVRDLFYNSIILSEYNSFSVIIGYSFF